MKSSVLNSPAQERFGFRGFFEAIVCSGKRNPRRAILCVSIMTVLLSCYPVVFLGRSFVSANNVPMLYSGIPSMPGGAETEMESFKGSDVGAIMWHDVPNSVIQGRALFRDGELPLWNRYNSCGLTLLGQGQSMFGVLSVFLPIVLIIRLSSVSVMRHGFLFAGLR